ncbi:MAG: MarR family winged helix-turn-helix transcriptional regulator [Pseudonocardiaceae bacterium]
MSDSEGGAMQPIGTVTDIGSCPVPVTTEDAGWLAAHLRAMVLTRPAAWALSEMTLPQLTALHYISAAGPVTLMGLAETLGTGPPATCAMVDRLARAGLVSREQDPKDRRRIQLTITKEAEPMIGDIDLDTARRLHAVLNVMSPSARRCLTDALRDTAHGLTRSSRSV